MVLIPARDEAGWVGATVRAALGLGPVVVVDDGSRDDTARVATEAGAAYVVVHRRARGKGAALASGMACLDGGRDVTGVPSPSRAVDAIREAEFVLFLDADLGDSAANAGPLVEAVRSGQCDMAIAEPPRQPGGGHGFVVRLARAGIRRLTGFEAAVPLSGQRCLTREAARAAMPLASRFGVEVGLTIDLLRQGFKIQEVPAELRHRVTGADWRAQLHRARQYRDVWLALRSRSRPRRSR